MRAFPILAAAALAVLTLGGGPRPAPLLVEPAAATPAARSDAAYPFHVKFDLLYQIEWREPQGLEGRDGDPCAPWRIDRGVTTVVARDAPWKRRGQRRARRHGMPGHLTVSANSRASTWASGSAVGWARATVQRRWVQSGGPGEGDVGNFCPGTEPWKPTPADCGERRFTTRTAAVLAQQRRRLRTLDEVMTLSGVPRASDTPVFSFSLVPTSALYRSCMASHYAPEHPTNLGVRITIVGIDDLLRLLPGKSVTGEWRNTGPCDDDLSGDLACTYKLDVDWDLTRWKPGTPFP
jgi:hypothetical protein